MRRPRDLRPDERELWHRIAASARPLHHAVSERPKPEADMPAHPAQRPADLPHFRIGEAAPLSRHGVAPAPAPAIRMDRRTFERMIRGKLAPEARLDLHGMTLSEAHAALIRFVTGAHASGLRLVLVITGKGGRNADTAPAHWAVLPSRAGVLRQQVPHWLALPPLGSLILHVAPASRKHGGEGACYVYLRR